MTGYNYSEAAVRREYEAKGYIMLRNGWPDFLAVKPLSTGGYELIGVEVKTGKDKLGPKQELMHKYLPFKCVVERKLE